MCKDNILRKEQMYLVHPYLIFLLQKGLQKWCEKGNVFGGSCCFGNEKPFTFVVCEKCLGKTFDLAFVSSSSIPSTKVFFTWCFV